MRDMILILNYSDEFAREAARRLRAEQVYSQIINGMSTAMQVKQWSPKGIILCGKASSSQGVLDEGILDLGIPVLALGHAAHMLLAAQGGACADTALEQKKALIQFEESVLFNGMADCERFVEEALMLMLPPDVQMIASAGGCTVAFEKTEKKQFGVQFQLERNDPEGTAILKNFALDVCGCERWWTIEAAQAEAEEALEKAAESGGSALCAVSGGIDSLVSACLTRRVFGEKMSAVFVDTGLLREGEADRVQAVYEALGIPLTRVDLSDTTLEALHGKQSMREKRDVVASALHEEMIRQARAMEGADTLVLGNNYSDYLTSGMRHARWDECGMNIVEPLHMLFKTEVRELAQLLDIEPDEVNRKPFPKLGLGARIIGEVTQERLLSLRMADAIFREEICEAGLDRKLYKYFPVLACGTGDMNMEMVILRAVTVSGGQLLPARLPYDLIERTTAKVLSLSPRITRVFYDQTPTPVEKETFL